MKIPSMFMNYCLSRQPFHLVDINETGCFIDLTFHFIKQEEKLFGLRLTQLFPKDLLLVAACVAKQFFCCKSLKPSQSLGWNASKSSRRSLLIFVTGEGFLKMSIDHAHVVKACK